MSLPTTCRSAGHHLRGARLVRAVANRCRIVDQRVEPDVHHVVGRERQRNAPELTGAADGNVLEPGFDEAEDLVAPDVGLQELRVFLEMFQQRVTIVGQAEEIILLADPFRRQRRVERALPVDQILLLLEGLAGHAVPAFVVSLVDVAPVVAGLRQLLDRRAMARLGRADEVVERDVELLPDRTKLLFHLVAVFERIHAPFERALVDVLRVLVVAHQEMRLAPRETLVAGDDVGGDLLVRRAEVRAAVDVVDGCREVEAHWMSGLRSTVYGPGRPSSPPPARPSRARRARGRCARSRRTRATR